MLMRPLGLPPRQAQPWGMAAWVWATVGSAVLPSVMSDGNEKEAPGD